jgi:hypothetical protein
MSKVASFPVDCACTHKKTFRLPVVIEEDKKKGAKPKPLQVNCPFRNEEGCAKHLTVELPAGYHLKKDEGIFRNGLDL